MMTSLSTQQSHNTLSDELAAATSELLDLGSTARKRPSHSLALHAPLPTPSPLNLAATSSAHLTLSSIISKKENARLELIDDDDGKSSDPSTRRNRAQSNDCTLNSPKPEISYDDDDNLPSSRLNSLIASVSNDTIPVSPSVSSPRLLMVEEAFTAQKWPAARESRSRQIKKSSSLTPRSLDSMPQRDVIPTFFTESFPDAQRSPSVEERTENKTLPSIPATKHKLASPPPMLALASPRPTQATLGEVSESNVIVKLHGNARLERESLAAPTSVEGDDALQNLEPNTGLYDDADRSSLLSLPATSLTDSSANSNKSRPKARRRKSNGSYSILSQDASISDDPPFARDVKIRGFTVVGEKARGFVCYDVRVITTRGTTISILRRFSSFISLKSSLSLERPQYAKLLPILPPKRSGLLHKYASHHLEKRRRALQKWLSIVILDRRWATTRSLQEWVVGDNEGA